MLLKNSHPPKCAGKSLGILHLKQFGMERAHLSTTTILYHKYRIMGKKDNNFKIHGKIKHRWYLCYTMNVY